MMPIPRRSKDLGVEAANEFWNALSRNDWVLIKGSTMGFYCVNCMISKGWSAYMGEFLDRKMGVILNDESH